MGFAVHERRKLTVTTPANLELVAADWQGDQAFTIPGGAGAAAVASRALLQPLRFLSLVTVATLEEPAAVCPLELLCTLVGTLGACLTQAARQVEISNVQLASASIRAMQAPGLSDALLADKVKGILLGYKLPKPYLSQIADATELRDEFDDGCAYHSSVDGCLRVEAKRVMVLGIGYACSLKILHAVVIPRGAHLDYNLNTLPIAMRRSYNQWSPCEANGCVW